MFVGVLAPGILSRCPTYTHAFARSPLAVASWLTVTPCRPAMPINVSPGRMVYVPPGLACTGFVDAAVAAPGIFSCCPMYTHAFQRSPLAAASCVAVSPCRAAMTVIESPARTT